MKVDKIFGKTTEDSEREKIQWFHIWSIEASDDITGYKIRYGFKPEDTEVVVQFGSTVRRTRGQQSVEREVSRPEQLYVEGKKMSKGKYEDIMDLLTFTPPIHHPFYQNLPY